MTEEARISHLTFLRDVKMHQLDDEERSTLQAGLRRLPFMADSTGVLRTADCYYDPYHPVFKAMLAEETNCFPPKPFEEFKWLDFLRLIGMQHEVSKTMFITFASKLAEEAKESPNDNTFHKSRTLVAHLFRRPNLLDEGLLAQVAFIPFIPPVKVSGILQGIYPQYEMKLKQLPYIPFAGSAPESFEYLMWTSAHLLPDWANPMKLSQKDIAHDYEEDHPLHDFEVFKEELTKALHIQKEPSLESVIAHVKNICGNVTQAGSTEELRAFMMVDVMKMVYRFLQQTAMDSKTVQEELKNVPCIVVDIGYTLVPPTQVVINLYEEEQIVPYLYKLPTELGEFKKVFLYLGATSHATADQYACVLKMIHQLTSGGKLHPNEMRSSFKAVRGLFNALQKHPNDDISTEVLYLPSTTGCLLKANDLVFNNDPTYTYRIRDFQKSFLVDLTECKVSAPNYEDLITMLPKHLQPAMLTDLVQELLEDSSRRRMMSYGIAEKLRHQINSRAFSHGITRLLRHEYHRSRQKLSAEIIEATQEKLKSIRVYGAELVMTYLSYEGQRIPGSELESDCFVDSAFNEDNEEEWTIYVARSASLNEEMLVSVAEVINRIIGGLLKNSVHYLQPILACAPHGISKVLDRLKIRPDHSVDFVQPTLPVPGSFVPMEDHHLLREDFDEFDPGEYVGYELEDDEDVPVFVYATIVEKMESVTDDKPILGATYRINVGGERKHIVVHATDLYKFHRVEGFVSHNTSMDENMFSNDTSSPKYPKYKYARRRRHRSRKSSGGSSTSGPSRRSQARQEKMNENTSPRHKPSYQRQNSESSQFSQQEENHGQHFHHQSQFNGNQENENHFQYNGQNSYSYRDAYFSEDNTAPNFQDQYQQNQEEHFTFDQDQNRDQHTNHTESNHSAQNGQSSQAEQEKADGQNTEQKEEASDGEKEITVEDLCEEVSDCLDEAWTLPEAQRRKVIKRLLLKWHPDKNIGDEQVATIVTQHIYAELERLAAGLPRESKFKEEMAGFQFDPRNPFAQSESFKRNFYNAYKKFYEEADKRAKEHKEQRKRYEENFSREYSSAKTEYNFDVPPSFSSSNPQPAQARRFFRQAAEDLHAADNDYDAKEPAYEWVCFKAHQAAEKALKAAQFSVDAMTSFSHDLPSIASNIEDATLRQLAIKLQRIVGSSNKMYTPDPIDYIKIPHDEYTKETAADAVICATDILEKVKEFMDLREQDA